MSALATAIGQRAKTNAKRRELKALVIDIERLPGTFTTKRRGLDITGDFWDLGQYRSFLGRLQPEDVTAWPSTLCFDAMWLGSKEHEFHAAWNGHEAMTRRAHELMSQADLVVTYNGIGFDEKHLNTDFLVAGLGPASPFKSVDLYRVVRSRFGMESKKLGSVLDRLQMPSKNDKYDATFARAAMAGDVKAQRRLERYNRGDVQVTSALLWALLPWVKGMPHVSPNLGEDTNICPRCASTNVHRDGTWTPGVYVYKAYKCGDCLGYYRTTYEHRGPSVRVL